MTVQEYFIATKATRSRDSWRYGDWEQFLCDRPDGSKQCARISRLNHAVLVCGLTLLILSTPFAIAWLFYGADAMNWATWATLTIGLGLIFLFLCFWLEDMWVMVSVGPRQFGDERIFDDEVPLIAVLGDRQSVLFEQLMRDQAMTQMIEYRRSEARGVMIYNQKQVEFRLITQHDRLRGMVIDGYLHYPPCDYNLVLLAKTRLRGEPAVVQQGWSTDS